MTIGLRDQRARVYVYGTGGAADSGFDEVKYTVLASPDADLAWWCRVEEPGGRELTVAEAAEHQSPAVIAFADEVVVPYNGVILLLQPDGTDGPLYRVASVNPRRLLREIAVQAVFADKALVTLVD